MNILGRLVGGLLILIGLGWLASTAGLPPFGDRRTANQLNNQKQGALPTTKTATNNFTTTNTPAKVTKTTTTTTAPAAVGTTNDAGTAQRTTTTTTSTAPVETSPRDATATQPLTTQPNPQPTTTTTVVVEQPTSPAAVPAGW